MSVALPAAGDLYPPEGEGRKRVFVVVPMEGAYRIVFVDGSSTEIEREPEPGASPEEQLARAKALAQQRVSQRREVAIGAGISVPGLGTVQTDPESLRNIGIKVRAALKAQVNGEEYSSEFRLEDNSLVVITGPQFLALDDMIDAAGDAVYAVSWAKKAQIEAASTLAEVANLLAELNEGWP